MARRKPYSKLEKKNMIRADHVKGKGDILWKGFQCINPECTEFIFVPLTLFDVDDWLVTCPKCGQEIFSGGHTKFYDYQMKVKNQQGQYEIKEEGEFFVEHDEYIAEAQLYKYCIVCNTMKPIGFFDKHSARKSGRQGECRLCKRIYNAIKNGTRITDQHREAAQRRRLLIDVAGVGKIESKTIYKKFHDKCFNCGKDLSQCTSAKEKPLDHTLPVYYLWPLRTDNATLLCRDCNGQKSGSWPSNFYSTEKLKELSVITGIDYSLLSGKPTYNPEAIEKLKSPEVVDNLLVKYAAYMDELIALRNRILIDTGFDFFKTSSKISATIIRKADELL
ncbi:MAG TPA: hypothetical protein PL100_03035 [Bacillota bacterium]|jgi:5-methylcytosine-specific restriction endonuclease McrA|nr:hypothetical protein [Bacillota bacterium]HQC48484.1 hypothetical protein [Bacillota bacterium]